MSKKYHFLSSVAILFLIAVLSPGHVFAKVPEGLVLYYTFDTEEDDAITDGSDAGNNGMIKGKPEWVDGKNGGALDFKVQGDYLEVPDSDSLKPDEMTFALWVNWTGDKLPAKPVQKYKFEQFGYVFKMEGAETNMWIYDAAGQTHMYRAKPLPVPGEWTHLAVTFDGAVQRGYVNGVKGAGDMAWAGPIGHLDVPLIIGASGGDTFTGMIDEIAIYNRALSEEEILETMEEGHGTIAVHPMDKLPICWANVKADSGL